MTQVKARPPHFAIFGNQLDALPKSYTRYLVNGLREAFELPGVPIRVSLRMGQEPLRQGADDHAGSPHRALRPEMRRFQQPPLRYSPIESRPLRLESTLPSCGKS